MRFYVGCLKTAGAAKAPLDAAVGLEELGVRFPKLVLTME